MTIRKMTMQDVAAVAALTTELGYASTGAEIARRFAQITARDDDTVLVADEGGLAIGWLHASAHPLLESESSAEILGLVVTDRHRNRGAGRALVTAAEEWARRRGCLKIRVRSRIARERACAFYEQNGFNRVKTQYCFEKPLNTSSAG